MKGKERGEEKMPRLRMGGKAALESAYTVGHMDLSLTELETSPATKCVRQIEQL